MYVIATVTLIILMGILIFITAYRHNDLVISIMSLLMLVLSVFLSAKKLNPYIAFAVMIFVTIYGIIGVTVVLKGKISSQMSETVCRWISAGSLLSSIMIEWIQITRGIIADNQITCENQNVNSIMRSAIWNHFADDLRLQIVEIDVLKEDAKKIWEKLAIYLPTYSLFQSDRKNNDGDSLVQDPLKEAVKQILNDEEIKTKLDEIAVVVQNKLRDVSDRTLEKLNEMDSSIANSLNPVIPETDALKWNDVFKNVSISGDQDIPINKRGSGVKRLVLLNFFRAEAERRLQEGDSTGIIYAIEEPETSQHTANQIMLIEALKSLADAPNSQVIITTHSSNVVKRLQFENIRLISSEDGIKSISNILPGQLNYPSLNEVN